MDFLFVIPCQVSTNKNCNFSKYGSVTPVVRRTDSETPLLVSAIKEFLLNREVFSIEGFLHYFWQL